jgi:transcription antitermination factor NusG
VVPGVEVFLPRIRFKRPTRRGPVWFTEALFPNYLFARFDWMKSLSEVMHSRGVSTVIHFGDQWPVVPDSDLVALRSLAGDAELYEISGEFVPGDEVKISGGAFDGLTAVVTRALPSRQRVAVLLEFLGRQTPVEVDLSQLVRAGDDPRIGLL